MTEQVQERHILHRNLHFENLFETRLCLVALCIQYFVTIKLFLKFVEHVLACTVLDVDYDAHKILQPHNIAYNDAFQTPVDTYSTLELKLYLLKCVTRFLK